MRKVIKFIFLGGIVLSVLLIGMLSCILLIPLDTSASDEFSINIKNETDTAVIAIGLEYDSKNNIYYVISSVHQPPLFYLLNFIPSGDSANIRYDLYTIDDDALYFLGISRDDKKYFAVVSEGNNKEIIFDESTIIDKQDFTIRIPYGLPIIHIIFAVFFYGIMKTLIKYFIRSNPSANIIKYTLLLFSIVNLLYAIGYVLVALVIKIYFYS